MSLSRRKDKQGREMVHTFEDSIAEVRRHSEAKQKQEMREKSLLEAAKFITSNWTYSVWCSYFTIDYMITRHAEELEVTKEEIVSAIKKQVSE